MKADMRTLAFPLPEDIARRKWSGDLDGATRIIRSRLQQSLPSALRRRLELELEILAALRTSYSVSEEMAQTLLAEKLQDFQPQELAAWRDQDWVDWICMDGQTYYLDRFYPNLLKTRPEIAARQLQADTTTAQQGCQLLDNTIALMRQNHGAASHMQLRSTIALTEPEVGTPVRAWLPLPVQQNQIKQLRLLQASQKPTHISDPQYPQRTVYFEGVAGTSNQFWVEYELYSYIPYVQPEASRVSAIQPTFYTQQEYPHIVFTPYLRSLTTEVVAGEKNPLKIARKIYDFITQNVQYAFMPAYFTLPNIPEYCTSRLRGDCGVQALTFITMCRIAGVPAKWQSGLRVGTDGVGHHDWAMFYVAPYGWLYCDLTYGGSAWRSGATERWNHYFCNLDPFRIVLATEFQTPFDPPMTYSRRDPYDNQGGEIEYASHAIPANQQTHSTQCLKLELESTIQKLKSNN